jgi:HPt (histidine-containing phosphotransfer) domain-containing protein
MSQPKDPGYRDHLRALGEKFAASIPQRMEAIADALEGALACPGRESLEPLHAALHAVAGSAGSFGFTVLGDEARRLEQIVRAALAGGPGWPEAASAIRHYLAWAAKDPHSPTFRPHD